MTIDSTQDSGSAVDLNQDLEPDRPPKWLNPVVAAVIGVVVLLLFGLTILRTLGEVGSAPVAANPKQGTESYSAFDRGVQVVGLVSPVLTIILGFYFGARAGTATAAAANARVNEAQRLLQHHQAASIAKDKALTYLQARIEAGSTDGAIAAVRAQHAAAFT